METSNEVTEQSNEDTGTTGSYWRDFLHLVSLLKLLNLLHFFADFAVADIMQMKVRDWDTYSCYISIDCRDK